MFNFKVYGKPLLGDTVGTIGFFDGVHIGHQRLFKQIIKLANNRQTVAITFDPHPIEFFNRDLSPKLINTTEQRVRNILKQGIDTVILAKFDKHIAFTSAENFIKDFLVGYLNIKGICIGENFRFGANREGNFALLKSLSHVYNYQVYNEKMVTFDDLPVSSTRIRSAICAGHMTISKKLLGSYFTLEGHVEKGRQVGRVMGFPTANLVVNKRQIIPAWGVYVTYTEIDGKKYFAGCNVGIKPTFGLNYVTIEAHFIDIDSSNPIFDLYDKNLSLAFVKKIRDEIEFPNTEALIARIKKDMDIVKEYKNQKI